MLFGASAFASGFAVSDKKPVKDLGQGLLAEIPNFCAHEHWGSISPIGQTMGGFTADFKAGALPSRRVTLVDLLMDPYMSGVLAGVGVRSEKFPSGERLINLDELLKKSHIEAFKLLKTAFGEFRLKGTYICLKRGVKLAYDFDIEEDDILGIELADSTIGDNYAQMFSWYRELMKKSRFSELIRPVHPEFYFSDNRNLAALDELSFTSTVLRIDPFMDFWQKKNSRRDLLSNNLGIDPVDAGSWRTFLEKILDIAEKNSCIGIKQLQAYSRDLNFEKSGDQDIRFRGKLTEVEIKKFQDWVVHECCRLANEKKWPHQVHVGTHNHPKSNPLPLEKLAKGYPDQKLVMLHCWPYIDEAGYLASLYPNVFIDTCWQQVLNPMFLRKSMYSWLGYLPHSKITMSNDSTSIEMAVGSMSISKQLLTEMLPLQSTMNKLTDKDIQRIVARFLQNNAVKIYGIGKEYII